ncbi:HAD-IIIA family hydrolase [Peribacillus sp. SCS-37]|uniref:HAD-IIIA family hydrolase n=1 Tax=Paraperibacillus esterisolvens TaxID=3115296 RepID=UPI003906C5F2
MKIRAVFIDRDGTLGGGSEIEYPGQFKMYPGAGEALLALNESGRKIFAFTNQPGISARLSTQGAFKSELMEFGFDKAYICPHQHGDGCRCRKPGAGILLRAAEEYSLPLESCAVIGDRWTDMLPARQAGNSGILVKTGAGASSLAKYKNREYTGEWAFVHAGYIAVDLEDAVQWILTK